MHRSSLKSCFVVGVAALGVAVAAVGRAETTVVRGMPDAAEMPGITTVVVQTPAAPPEWAIWQRQLLDRLAPAALSFTEKYARDDGTLRWRDQWPGMDGSDDGYESFYSFPLYYALGGPDEIDPLARKLWDGITRQFTGYGQVHREFDAYYDWMHHGESYVYFYSFGLTDPTDSKTIARARRFADFYTGNDPKVPNYDAERRLIRSPITGSRGPRFVNSAEDWVTHRAVLAHYPLPYDDIPGVTQSSDWLDDRKFPAILKAMNGRMMRGDVPLNLNATSLVLNAYLYSGEESYRQWVETYVQAWIDRTQQNEGVLPDNVGLNGKIGECMEGRWWGGYYGWHWPHGLNQMLEATLVGAGNAYLASGDPKYLELPRMLIKAVQREGRREDGRFLVPHRYGDQGWSDFRPINPTLLVHLWYLSQDPSDRQLLEDLVDPQQLAELRYAKGKGDSSHAAPWLGFLEGKNSDYPVAILQSTWSEAVRRVEAIHNDHTPPEQRNVHHWQELNPVVLEGLVQLMLGAPNHLYHGGLLQCRVFYFDPVRKRPGLPPDTAAMVTAVEPERITLRVVNLNPAQSRDVVVQAGAFGEHEFTEATCAGTAVPVNRRYFRLRLQPSATGEVSIGMKRYVNKPRYRFPWCGE